MIGKEEIKAVEAVLKSGQLSGFRATIDGNKGGPRVQQLEDAFCDYFDVGYAVAMNSATACLHSALIACGIGLVDTVVVPAMSFSSSASCVLMAGAKPIFGDIDEDTFTLDVLGFEPITSTKAIIPVHLHGHPANMKEIMIIAEALNLKVIEDASQAIGAKYKDKYVGTIGDCGIFSFNQNKIITAGSGGMLITDNFAIAETAKLVRNHGETQSGILGYNYRMGEIEAAILIEQLKKLDKLTEERIERAHYLTDCLSDIPEIITPVTNPDCKHVFFRYAMKYTGKNRNHLQDKLISNGVFFGDCNYGKPLYRQDIYRGIDAYCPVAERLYLDEIMVTDILKHPRKEIKRMVEIVKGTLNAS